MKENIQTQKSKIVYYLAHVIFSLALAVYPIILIMMGFMFNPKDGNVSIITIGLALSMVGYPLTVVAGMIMLNIRKKQCLADCDYWNAILVGFSGITTILIFIFWVNIINGGKL